MGVISDVTYPLLITSPVTAWMEYGLVVRIFWSLSALERSPDMKLPADPESTMAVAATLKSRDFRITHIVNGVD